MTTLRKPVITRRPPNQSTAPATGEAVPSEALMGGRTELKIRHNGDTYSLRKTRLGKLILTK